MTNFGLLIKQVRLEERLDRPEFGERWGVSGAVVTNWENGVTEAPYDVLSYCLEKTRTVIKVREVCPTCDGTGFLDKRKPLKDKDEESQSTAAELEKELKDLPRYASGTIKYKYLSDEEKQKRRDAHKRYYQRRNLLKEMESLKMIHKPLKGGEVKDNESIN